MPPAKSLANLRPGNPPVDIGKRGYSVTSAIKHLLSQTSKDGKPNYIAIAEGMIELAQNPDKRGYVPIVKEILDRTDGKLKDSGSPTYNNIKVLIVREKPPLELPQYTDGVETGEDD